MSSLYLEHFGFSESPFDLPPSRRFFFAGGMRGEVLDGLVQAALAADSIVTVTGDAGCGKTMLSQMLAKRLRVAGFDLVYIPQPVYGPQGILDFLLTAWKLDLGPERSAVQSIHAELLSRQQQGRRVVVLIDEAHGMRPDTLVTLAQLADVPNSTHTLMQLVLFGQPSLQQLLALPSLQALQDKLLYRFALAGWSEADTRAYVEHRLRTAGWRGGALFHPQALTALIQAAAGHVRHLHVLADKALLAAYAEGAHEVQAIHVRALQSSPQTLEMRPSSPADVLVTASDETARGGHEQGIGTLGRWSPWGAIGLLVLVVGGTGVWMSKNGADAPPAASATPTPTALVHAAAPHSPVAAPPPLPSVAPLPDPPAPTATAVASPVAAAQTPAFSDVPRYAGLPTAIQERLAASQTFFNATNKGWTIQVGVAKNTAELQTLLAQVQALTPVWVHERYYSKAHVVPSYAGLGLVWAVYVGHYPARAEAYEAMRQLSVTLPSLKPVVRTLGGIRSEAIPTQFPPV